MRKTFTSSIRRAQSRSRLEPQLASGLSISPPTSSKKRDLAIAGTPLRCDSSPSGRRPFLLRTTKDITGKDARPLRSRFEGWSGRNLFELRRKILGDLGSSRIQHLLTKRTPRSTDAFAFRGRSMVTLSVV